MISNPGVSISPNTMMTSIYDTENKKRDIFQYVDSKVADKVSSLEVTAQIASATSNFVTASQASEINRYNWTVVPFIPFTGSPAELSVTHTKTTEVNLSTTSYTVTNEYYAKQLPIPLELGDYAYEVEILTLGMKTYEVVTSSGSVSGRNTYSLNVSDLDPTRNGIGYSIEGIPCSLGYKSSETIWCNPVISRRIFPAEANTNSVSNVWAYDQGFIASVNDDTAEATSYIFNPTGNIRNFDQPGSFTWMRLTLSSSNTRFPQYNSTHKYETYGIYFMYRAIRG